MEGIEDYSIFGINIGGGKKQPAGSKGEMLFVSRLLGGAVLGLSVAQILNSTNNLERFIAALYTKYIRLFDQPDTFKEKV
jgi:hypothetical protein